ncbi:hypothetical protein CTEN210_09894 [Chaetoceros tenuissimus]|uniref:RNA 2-O ribose methyltransferase substrate binding domain-containing protein n=1 Tax=Chaetoceros tenuissimus TaxID=426638 RepID=A0AAD3H817_9STRA|nr:hypothetical protein CTEN210_09894 [Chaetoceros tenuissimus]
MIRSLLLLQSCTKPFAFTFSPSSKIPSRLFSSSSSFIQNLQNEDPISSPKSKTVKQFQQLINKAKARSQSQMTVLEGHRLILDTLANQSTRKLYNTILVSQEALDHPTLGPRLQKELTKIGEEQIASVKLATNEVIKAASDTVTPQGVVATISIPPQYQYNDSDKSRLFLIFDGISDPGNVGTLLRSAKAVGAECVLLLPGSCDVWNPKAIRSAMGTSFQVPIRSMNSWQDCQEFIKECGVDGERIYAATMEGSEENDGVEQFEALPHFNVDWVSNSNALVLGKEGPGLSEQVRQSVRKAEIRSVYIPMEEGIESLNVGTCGSVIMFEFHRQILQR